MPVFPDDPLVTYADYVLVTSDTSSAVSAVEAAIEDAIDLAEQITGRLFLETERTETIRVAANGRVYPKATPISEVTDPEDLTVDGASVVTGWGGTLWPDRTLVGAASLHPTVEVTYTGGWTRSTFPAALRRLICQAVYDLLHAVRLQGVPAGATTARVQDVSVTAGSGATLDPVLLLSSTVLGGLESWRKARVTV